MKFLVWCPDKGATVADALGIDAFDAGAAAEQWADHEDWSSAEYSIVGGQDATVMVSDGTVQRKFIVSGESVRQYRASESSKE